MNRYRNPRLVEIFYHNMRRLGVEFMVNLIGDVVVVGPAVSPEIQRQTELRAGTLRPLILAESVLQAEHETPAFVPVGRATAADYAMMRVAQGGRRRKATRKRR